MFPKRNKDVREALEGIPQWMIAEEMGVHETTLCRWLRTELPDWKKQRIINAANVLKQHGLKEAQ